MLFNSLPFLYLFLPVTYLVFLAAAYAISAIRLAHDHGLRLLFLLEPRILRPDGLVHRG
jgi:hypothetical protein